MTAKIKIGLSVLVLFISGCFSATVNPGSERVRVFETEPKGCLYVGEVSTIQKDRNLGTLETEMSLDTRIELRNQAHKLGGNILVFLKGKNSNALPGSTAAPAAKAGTPASTPAKTAAEAPKVESNSEGEEVEKGPLVFLATVFKCPSTILNQ